VKYRLPKPLEGKINANTFKKPLILQGTIKDIFNIQKKKNIKTLKSLIGYRIAQAHS
jgi:hypothetical protein